MYNKDKHPSFEVTSFHKLWDAFNNLGGAGQLITDIDSVSCLGDRLNGLKASYDNKNIEGIKRLLFGNLSDSIDLYLVKALLGVRSDGIKVKVENIGWGTLRFEGKISKWQGSNKYDKLKLKIKMAGFDSKLIEYDDGLMCYGDITINHLPSSKCRVLK